MTNEKLPFLLPHILHRSGDHFFEDFLVDVGKALDVEAGLTGFMFADFCKQLFVTAESAHDIHGEVLFAWRKARERPITLAATGILVRV
mgnify:CR=1 FL=1